MKNLEIAVPKGHLWNNVISILELAGYHPTLRGERSYFIETVDPDLRFMVHRAQNIGPLIEEGIYDLGITGLDWIRETNIDVKELLDLGFGKVNLVVAIPQYYFEKIKDLKGNKFHNFMKVLSDEGKNKVIVASEYENLTEDFCSHSFSRFPYRVIRSYGATETFIRVADMIIECSETGTTLRQNGWEIIETLFESTARLIANKSSLTNEWKHTKINDFRSLLKGALDAKGMKLLKMNVPEKQLKEVIKILPSMKSPTISKLFGENDHDYALEVAVDESEVINVIPRLKKAGATDILELNITKVVK